MKTVWILRGLPGSGKSFWAKAKVASSNSNIKRINKDILRDMLDSGKHSKGNESYVLQLRDNILLTSLDLGKSVIIDDTNFHPKHEERVRELVNDFNKGLYGNNVGKNPVQVKVKFFDVPPEECIKRDLERANSVGSKIIWDMYNKYLKPKQKEIEVLDQDSNLPHAIIVDIDGTVAINNDRSPYDGTKVDQDTLNEPIANLVRQYISNPYIKVIFLSGREGTQVCAKLTEEWLSKHFDGSFELHMRNEGDHRKDSIIKQEIFEQAIKDKYFVRFILDDRNCVVSKWRELGLTCLQVADGDF